MNFDSSDVDCWYKLVTGNLFKAAVVSYSNIFCEILFLKSLSLRETINLRATNTQKVARDFNLDANGNKPKQAAVTFSFAVILPF